MSDRAPSQAEEAGSSRSRSGAASVEAEPVAAAEYDARSASVADVASMNADPTIPIQAANTSASSLSYVSVPGPQQFEPVEALLVTSPVADGGTSAPTESVAAVLISPVNTSRQSIPLGAQVVPITGSPVASSAGHAASVRSAPPVESAYIGSPSGPASSVGHVSVSQQPISVIQAVPPPALPSAGSSSTLPSAAVSVSGTPPQPAEASSSAQRVILIPTTTVYSMPPQSSQQSFPEAAPPPPPKTYAHSGTSAPTGAHPQQFYAPSAPNISIGSGMDIANGSTNVAPPAHSPRERPPSLTMPGTYMPEPQPSLPIHMQPHQQPRHERRLSLTWDPNTYSRHSHSSLNRGPPLSPPHTTALTNIDSGRYPQSPTQEQIEARLGGETDYFAQSPGVQPPQPALSRHSSSRRSYGGRDRPANYYDQPPVPSQQQRQPTPNARGDDDQQPGESRWQSLQHFLCGRRKHSTRSNTESIMSGTDYSLGDGTSRTVGRRLRLTLKHAEKELEKARSQARVTGWSLNIAIGAQVILGALTTGVAAATSGRQTSIATSILGGLSTLAASYLARARGSGEPEASSLRCKDLENFVRELESTCLDRGNEPAPDDNKIVMSFRARFEEIMGNAPAGVNIAEMLKDKIKEEYQHFTNVQPVAHDAKQEDYDRTHIQAQTQTHQQPRSSQHPGPSRPHQ